MSASLTSGTYGRQSSFAFSGAFLQLMSGLFGSRPVTRSSNENVRVREANEVRELARSVEMQSPGFAADLYAAALRHEGLDD
jgi:hypothetical protein